MSPPVSRRAALLTLGGAAVATVAGCRPGPLPQPASTAANGIIAAGSSAWARAAELTLGQASWCWFSTPRSVIDGSGRLYAGGVHTGSDSGSDGDIVVFEANLPARTVARHRIDRSPVPDDHANPSVSLPWGPHGAVWTGWAPHATVDAAAFTREGTLVASPGGGGARVPAPGGMRQVGGNVFGSSYFAAAVVGGRRWLLSRRRHGRWQLWVEDGPGWKEIGELVLPASNLGQGGLRPYHLVASDGQNLHVAVSTNNPTETKYSAVYHFVVRGRDYAICAADGRVIGQAGTRPVPTNLLPMVYGGQRNGRNASAWPVDITFDQGRPNILISSRDTHGNATMQVPGAEQRLRYVWARLRITRRHWDVQHLAFAGSNLYRQQPDYSGLAALAPGNPFEVVVSTNVNPVSGRPLRSRSDGRVHWELWHGQRRHHDRAWLWRPATADSTSDNLRPHLAAGGGYRSLTWMRGSYPHYRLGNTRLVTRFLR